ncbi:MAG: ABC transporter permease [Pseudomonadota bacterium]
MRSAVLPGIFQAVSGNALRDNPGRLVLALLGIALGVALGLAMHLVNTSALNEFNLAVRSLSGEADLVIRGPRGGFDETVYPRIARLPQVRAASPAIEIEAQLAGRKDALTITGIDPLRAAQVQPELLAGPENRITDLFDPDVLFLSHTAAAWLGLKVGDKLRVNVGTSSVELKIAGLLSPGAYRQRLAVMDIASAQWRLQQLGRINRIDVRLRPGSDAQAVQRELAQWLPAGVHATTPDAESGRSTGMSRAYRLNLDMLALVALFTGAFLVFSTQVLATLRRRTHFAMLRAIGLTRPALTCLLLGEGALIGALGSTLGVALGYALAGVVLEKFGTDLGAGYFRALAPVLHADARTLAAFWLLGIAFAIAGTAIPAVEAGRRAPALALKAGDEEQGLKNWRTAWPGMVMVSGGLVLTQAPAVSGLPLFGYAAVALILLGAVLLMPWLAAAVLRRLPALRYPPAMLAIAQLQATPRQAAICIAAVVTSFSLTVAMLIMVGSFRQSLDAWLTTMLPADLYLRAARAGETGFLTPEQQARIASAPGIGHAEFLRSRNLLLDPVRPPVTLLARPIDAASARSILPLLGPELAPHADEPPAAWISEVAGELFGFKPGDRISLPLDGQQHVFTVAGIWRDYARQNGAIVIDRALYMRITGDGLANDAALRLAEGATPDRVAQALLARLGSPDGIEIATTGKIRDASLSTFDRTFAVTYALEIIAVLIGLFGVSASFGAQALARRREFGMLRHIGITRFEIGIMLGCEGMLVSSLGIACGLAIGWLVSLVLIHVINRQSFHWSMNMDVPWLPLVALAVLLITAASATAVWSGRRAMSGDVVGAVREDW